MSTASQRGRIALMTTFAAAALGLGAGRAEAQIGIGMGMGGGMFGFYGMGGAGYVQQPSTFVNQVALAQMNHVRGPINNNVYANDPNAYFNRVRDNGFVDRYYPDRREPSYYGYAARPRPQRPAPAAATAARHVVPLTTFFNDKNQLIWPGDAPVGGDLKPKRDEFDKACKAVLDESKSNAVASIASVTEARQKLLDYGRPALKDIRDRETPRVADSFHVFLLSLYDSLAQAANPPAKSS